MKTPYICLQHYKLIKNNHLNTGMDNDALEE